MSKVRILTVLVLAYLFYQISELNSRLDHQRGIIFANEVEIADLKLKIKSIKKPEPKIVTVGQNTIEFNLFSPK